MRNFRPYEPEQMMILPFDTAKYFPEGTFERFLVKIIDKIDISGFYSDEKSKGEIPINPRSLLGIIFYGITKGEFRSRKIEEGCKNHFGYMYISGFNTPDHSTICRFINNFNDQIKDVFVQIFPYGRMLYTL